LASASLNAVLFEAFATSSLAASRHRLATAAASIAAFRDFSAERALLATATISLLAARHRSATAVAVAITPRERSAEAGRDKAEVGRDRVRDNAEVGRDKAEVGRDKAEVGRDTAEVGRDTLREGATLEVLGVSSSSPKVAAATEVWAPCSPRGSGLHL